MQWALVLYSLTFLHADGRPTVATFHPAPFGEAECRIYEADARTELRRHGYVAVCQRFEIGAAPVWPWNPTFRPAGVPRIYHQTAARTR